MGGEIGAVVRDRKAAARRLDGERVGQRALAVARVVAVRFAVGGDVDQLVAPAPFDEREALNARKAQLESEGIDTFVRQY